MKWFGFLLMLLMLVGCGNSSILKSGYYKVDKVYEQSWDSEKEGKTFKAPWYIMEKTNGSYDIQEEGTSLYMENVIQKDENKLYFYYLQEKNDYDCHLESYKILELSCAEDKFNGTLQIQGYVAFIGEGVCEVRYLISIIRLKGKLYMEF